MSENFNRAIRDLDTRDPRAFQDARHAILDEIRIHHEVPAQSIVNAVNRVENSPGHAHQDVQLVNRNGYLDIVPANYGRQEQPGYPPPGYQGEYRQPQPIPYEGGYQGQPQPVPYEGNYNQPQQPYQYGRPAIDPGSLILGGVIGAVIAGHRRY